MKIRIKFRKYGVMKFIGHLDMMRYFQKAMRRANIDICYSEGFSPHQIMSFAAPLGVGITSDGEYLDIEVHSSTSTEQALKALNDTMVEGIEITGYVQLKDNAKTAMSIVAAADYELSFKEGYQAPADFAAFEQGIKEYFTDAAEFLVTKKTKKSEKVMDLKELVYDIHMITKDGQPAFYLNVCTGSTNNLKPEMVLEALFEKLGFTYDANAIQIHRLDVYAYLEDEKRYISLGEMGSNIVCTAI
ncbi:MAG: TIGR03936 family radical SAM-associated protein [Roseburia sp.]|uniref:TIGR03936 family radical SAM-associated protein n=1 Tax=Roseburia sp. 831b TaxID=1261635 RepID=UPI00095123AC|nr:TIGR03936 family radical SAM-associated protein [Roseburia sp. 831b]MCI5918317.1 TIGR03936 family radical SAM-associated protein [Roseburia sp.]MDD6217079.1 TIGR03936 family radical SAM-associated protein [Roseburia sp.]MDY5882246.1 TIGR03936 family radical SAM-associated protein [Roseburia sp.]WVK73976.1 TIGR03936 family radical SAM-associated protein [Roseburia sp. 831b]